MSGIVPIRPPRPPAKWAWFGVVYVGLVILFGAVVRVTGSGAGCGTHWPTCQGEIVHLPRKFETLIELSHRVTSGISLLVVLGLFWLVRRDYDRGHGVRYFAAGAVIFLVIESLIGAVLVLFGLVVGDRSMARAFMMPLHLANASALMASLSLVAYGMTQPLPARPRTRTVREWQIVALLAALLVASMLGALTALGDTLFPPNADSSIWTHVAQDQSSRAHWLERLRVIHPVVSVVVAVYALRVALVTLLDNGCTPWARRLAHGLLGTLGLQLVAGALNVWFNAPAILQVLHLALALVAFNLVALLWADAGAKGRNQRTHKPSSD